MYLESGFYHFLYYWKNVQLYNGICCCIIWNYEYIYFSYTLPNISVSLHTFALHRVHVRVRVVFNQVSETLGGLQPTKTCPMC